jgi:ATP-dependent RNA helicase DBP3
MADLNNNFQVKDKKDKKEKKNRKDKQIEEAVIVTETENDEIMNNSESTKDKKRKHEEDVSEESNGQEDADEAERKRQKKEKKKAKKEKKEQETITSAPTSSTRQESTHTKATGSNPSNLYHEHPSTSSMTAEKIDSYREEHRIALDPPEESLHYKPIDHFEYIRPSVDAKCPFISQYITRKGFAHPSPIQSQCWPILLSGKDAIGIAATGSGKTLAFLIPAMLKIASLPKPSNENKHSNTPAPRVLILAPTRELAMQSHQVVEEMAGPKGVCIYGGVPKQQQKQDLRNGAEIVVATPGRLMDLLDEKALSLASKRIIFQIYYSLLLTLSFLLLFR